MSGGGIVGGTVGGKVSKTLSGVSTSYGFYSCCTSVAVESLVTTAVGVVRGYSDIG